APLRARPCSLLPPVHGDGLIASHSARTLCPTSAGHKHVTENSRCVVTLSRLADDPGSTETAMPQAGGRTAGGPRTRKPLRRTGGSARCRQDPPATAND